MSEQTSKNEKAKSSRKQKQLDQALAGLSGKERRAAEEKQREKRRMRIYIAIGVIIAVLVVGLLTWDSGIIQSHAPALTVGGESYSSVEVGYYFNSTYNSIYSYASYYGLDTSVSLKEQEAYSGCTWYDYLLDSATESLTSVSILAQEGEAAGYELSEEGEAEVEEAMEELAEEASENGVSEAYVLRAYYGRFMTKKIYKNLVRESVYASEYAEYVTDSFEVTEDDLEEYYEENADTIDTYDYECYLINATADSTTDDDGNTVDPTEEETAQALEDATNLADELEAAFADDDDDAVATLVAENDLSSYSSISPSYFSSYDFGEWLTDADRAEGDTTIITLTSTSTSDDDEEEEVETVTGYYVLKFNSRVRDDYYGVNLYDLELEAEEVESEDDEDEDAETVYDMDTALENITVYRDLWLQMGGNGEAFASVALTNSSSSSASNGGLTENVYKGKMTDVIDEWLFGGDAPEVGSYEILEDTENNCYYLVYVDSYQELYYWQTSAKSSIQSDRYSDWYTETAENYEVSTTAFLSTLTVI
ncbi:MAG: YxlC family protein [Clostridiales bacterium]|nr:YxlC family protein [Clostridiales bacterium]